MIGFFYFGKATSLGKGKRALQTSATPLKNWSGATS